MFVTGLISKNNSTIPQLPVVVGAAAAKDVMPDRTENQSEMVYRAIQNVGLNPCYVACGRDASSTQYDAILNPASQNGNGGQQFVVPTCERVSVYSTAGTTIAVQEVRNNAIGNTQPNILVNQP